MFYGAFWRVSVISGFFFYVYGLVLVRFCFVLVKGGLRLVWSYEKEIGFVGDRNVRVGVGGLVLGLFVGVYWGCRVCIVSFVVLSFAVV